MQPVKQFHVFGELVELLVPSSKTNGSFSQLIQTSPPGGGPPPHVHQFEDEIFRVLEGEFEFFDGTAWTRLAPGETAYKLRGQVHTFRNCGATPGRIHITVVPGRFDQYLEAVAPLEIPRDIDELMQISEIYGIRFVTADTPVPTAA